MSYLTPPQKAETLRLLTWLGCLFSALASATLIVLFGSHPTSALEGVEDLRPLALGISCVCSFVLAILGMRMDDATVQQEIRNCEYLVS